ncbi:MAG: T9SS type A sorting domain-containing protein [Bacteroidia bacterium]
MQGRHFAHINTSGLSAGFYTVSVKTQNAQSVTKLIVR